MSKSPMTRGLVRYDAMCRAINAAYEVDEVKDIHDRAVALEHYERLAKNIEAEDRCYQIRWRAANKAGELLKVMEKAKPNPAGANQYTKGKEVRSNNSTEPKTLADLGISKQQSSDWQKLAAVPKAKFEQALAEKSVRDLIDKPTPVSDDAQLFIGTMRDFERHGYLSKTPADFMATMTETMLEEVYRIAPLAAAWLSTTPAAQRVAKRKAPSPDWPPAAPICQHERESQIEAALKTLERIESEFHGNGRFCEFLRGARGELKRIEIQRSAKKAEGQTPDASLQG